MDTGAKITSDFLTRRFFNAKFVVDNSFNNDKYTQNSTTYLNNLDQLINEGFDCLLWRPLQLPTMKL